MNKSHLTLSRSSTSKSGPSLSVLKGAAALIVILAPILVSSFASSADGQEDVAPKERTRTLYVPFEDLHVLLEGQTERVFLTREEYEALKEAAKQAPLRLAPRPYALLSSSYEGRVELAEASFVGTIEMEVLNPGIHEVPLEMQGLRLLSATLDGEGAPLIRDSNGTSRMLVEGVGNHTIAIAMTAPVNIAAAQQSLQFTLPYASSGELKLTVPGNVEVKSGAEVVNREYEEATNETQFELLPRRGATALVMSLNNKTLRDEQLITARSVVVSEITSGYERLHGTISYDVLHGAIAQLKIQLPADYQVTQVETELLDVWKVSSLDDGRQELEIQLREETRDALIVRMSAIRTPSRLGDWTMPIVEPVDVAGAVAVLGVVAESRLTPKRIAASGLIPLDTSVVTAALPNSVLEAEAGAPSIQPVAAFYAPGTEYELGASLTEPEAGQAVVTNLLLTISDEGLAIDGGFDFAPSADKTKSFDFEIPSDWRIAQVQLADGQVLEFDRLNSEEVARIHVELPTSVRPGNTQTLYFTAEWTPTTWLDDWDQQSLPFPTIRPVAATTEQGAIAIRIEDDLQTKQVSAEGLSPLDSSERAQFGLSAVADDIAFRFTAPEYQLGLEVERARPWLVSRNYSFFSIGVGALRAHYEIMYRVEQARVREVQLDLPATTPESLAFRGADGVEVKESTMEVVDGVHRWTVRLAQPVKGGFRLICDFEQKLESQDAINFDLPLIRAVGVAFQNEMVAIEGDADLDIDMTTQMRVVDVGELSEADYLPGSQLLAAFDAVEGEAAVSVQAQPRELRSLPPAIVQRAELVTMISTSGRNQTAARYLLRTKVSFVEIELPKLANLWAVMLDGKPVKPQRRGDAILLTLQGEEDRDLQDLQVVYEAPVQPVDLWGRIDAIAPKLLLKDGVDEAGRLVPQADLVWHLHLPRGYDVSRTHGSVFRADPIDNKSPVARLAQAASDLGGGVRKGWLEEIAPVQVAADYATSSENQTMPRSYDAESSDDDALYDSFSGDEKWEEESADESMSGEGFRDAPGRRSRETLDPSGPPIDNSNSLERTPEFLPPGASNAPGGNGEGQQGQGSRQGQEANQQGRPMQQGESGSGGGSAGAGFGGGAGFGDDGSADGGDGDSAGMQPGFGSESGAQSSNGGQGPATTGLGGEVGQQPEDTIGKYWAMQGLGSLAIELAADGEMIAFTSVGDQPVLDATIVHRDRLSSLAWGVAIAIFVGGLLIDRLGYGVKVTYVVVAVMASLGLPLLGGPMIEFELLCDRALYSSLLLIPYFVCSSSLSSLRLLTRRRPQSSDNANEAGASARSATPNRSSTVACLFVAATLLSLACQGSASAQQNDPFGAPSKAQESAAGDDLSPVPVPEDALIVPYDPDDPEGRSNANQVLVPYSEYQRLWSAAYPDQPLTPKSSIEYAIAGSNYQATLSNANNDDESDALTVRGVIEIEVFADDREVQVPLALRNAVVTSALLDGEPARLRAVLTQENAPANGAAPPVMTLGVRGKGRHEFEVEISVSLQRQGGWQTLDCQLPIGPAAELEFEVPATETQLRLSDGQTQRAIKTEEPGQIVRVAPGIDSGFRASWRPKVDEGSIDQGLTVESRGILDIREDGLRLSWHLQFSFGRTERGAFRFEIPAGFVVESITGTNVRGWELVDTDIGPAVDVQLLKAVRQTESLDVVLSQRSQTTTTQTQRFDTPYLTVSEAALHRGVIAIRRSPILNVRTLATSQVARTSANSLPADMSESMRLSESPLGQRLFQVFRFNATPFQIALESSSVDAQPDVEFQSLFRLGETESSLESRFVISDTGRGLQRLDFSIPSEMTLESVDLGGTYLWSIDEGDVEDAPTKTLRIFLSEVRVGQIEVAISGRLVDHQPDALVPLPRLILTNSDAHEGTVVVQADPSLDVVAKDLSSASTVLLDQAMNWLNAEQQPLARLAIRCSDAEFAGAIQLIPKQPRITCDTITNVRLTYRAIEETMLIDYRIEEAGVRELSFRLPNQFANARILARMVRQETRQPIDDSDEIRVTLALQDAIMGDYRIVIEQDRSLVLEPQSVPIPQIETGEATHQYITLQNAGRDEITVAQAGGFEALSRGQSQWQALADKLGGGDFTIAHVLREASVAQAFQYEATRRQVVETSGATIGLAETIMIVDGGGGYRAAQLYRIDNRTEPYLEIELPESARLWTAFVAGRPVKPAVVPGGAETMVRIPLVKTAEGDLDYEVVLKYGGSLGVIENWDQISFPLMKTGNINVEQSQVRLWLPETHNWFNFDGTAVQVDDPAELDASYLAYQTRQVERLTEALRSNNTFSVTRAAGNLKKLQVDVPVTSPSNDANVNYRQNLFSNNAAIEQAMREVDEIENSRTMAIDNRDQLNDFFKEQRNDLSTNSVNRVGSNFALSIPMQANEEGNLSKDFDADWLRRNGLSNNRAGEIAGQQQAQSGQNEGGFRYQSQFQEQAEIPSNDGQSGKELFGGLQRGGGRGGRMSEDDSDAVPGDEEERRLEDREAIDLNSQYEQRLAQQQQGNRPGTFSDNGFAMGNNFTVDAFDFPATSATGGTFGLASLDVELPERGTLVMFTTPRGNVEINARAVDQRTLDRSVNAAWLGGILAVLSIVAWVVRKLTSARVGTIMLGTLLILAGVVSFVSGYWPWIGALMVLTGMLLLLQMAVRRRYEPQTA